MILQIIDPITATLIAAVTTLIGLLIVTILNATILETRRQNRIRETEKKALREALYSEIGWTLTNIAPFLPENAELVKFGPLKFGWHDLKTLLSSRMSSAVYKTTRGNPVLFYQLHDAMK